MSTPINDGGPAYPGTSYIPGRGNCQPVTFPDGQVEWQEMSSGMSLRDWFAGQALANRYTFEESNPQRAADWAYQLADAMLAAKEGKGTL